MLRKPIGNYTVGTCYFDTDYIGKDNYKRRLPVMVFYPTDKQGEKCLYKTTDYFKAKIDGKCIDIDIFTHCYDNVPLSVKEKQYPVILYSHGLRGYLMDSTVLCTDLASLGYIVFSVGHPYGAGITYYQDGTSFDGWIQIKDDEKPATLWDNIKLLLGILPVRSYEKRNASWMKYCKYYKKMIQKLIPLWEEDLVEGMNYIEKIACGKIDSIFNEKLIIDQGMGIIGMSLGGCCSIGIGLKDSRVSYCIDLDGGIFAEIEPIRWDVPILILREAINAFAEFPLRALHYKNLYVKKIKGLTHWQFADGVYLSDKGRKNKVWADEKSKEKTMTCLNFIKQIERGK